MSEIRHDWLADRWVIFAPDRNGRPDDFATNEIHVQNTILNCPFCKGHEQETPPPVLTLPSSSGDSLKSSWQVRVVPNRFPAVSDSPFDGRKNAPSLRDESSLVGVPVGTYSDGGLLSPVDEGRAALGMRTARSGNLDSRSKPFESDACFFQSQQLLGAHEVIVESPRHIESLSDLSIAHVSMIFEAYRQRLIHWRAHIALRYAVVFKNVGADAGASLLHPHSQLIATSFVPPEVNRIQQRLHEFDAQHANCYFCTMIDEELSRESRIVCETNSLVALCPFASRLPFLTWILPKSHAACFEECSDVVLCDLAKLVQQLVRRIELLHPNTAYNYVIHTSPFHSPVDQLFHWRIELFPRLVKVAGFEWGSDCFINPVFPETAASRMRD